MEAPKGLKGVSLGTRIEPCARRIPTIRIEPKENASKRMRASIGIVAPPRTPLWRTLQRAAAGFSRQSGHETRGKPLPDGRGSVNRCVRSGPKQSRDRKEAVSDRMQKLEAAN